MKNLNTNKVTKLFLAILAAFVVNPLFTQRIEFTNNCEDRASNTELQAMKDAHSFIVQHANRILEEIEIDRNGSNNHLYTKIDASDKRGWLNELKKTIKVNCETRICRNNRGQMGRCYWPSDDWFPENISPGNRIIQCPGNQLRMAQQQNSSYLPIAIGSMAHEIMHQVDGFEGLVEFGSPSVPITSAETIGVAAEHLALTPDLEVTITDLKLGIYGGENITETTNSIIKLNDYVLRFKVTVKNINPWSGTARVTVGLSGDDRNSSSILCVKLNGKTQEEGSIRALSSNNSQTIHFITKLNIEDAVKGKYVLEAIADAAEQLTEYNETNNSDSKSIGIFSDLVITNEIAGPYTEHSQVFHSNDGRETEEKKRWNTLTYVYTISNIGSLVCPPTDILFKYDDMWTSTPLKTKEEFSTPILEPGKSYTNTVDVDIPVNSTGGIDGNTNLYFIIENTENTIYDYDVSNNVIHLVVNENYFQPDYQIELNYLEFDIDADSVFVKGKVVNKGPEPGDNWTVTGFFLNENRIDRVKIPKIEVTGTKEFSFKTDFEMLSHTSQIGSIELVTDISERLSESDENNNSVVVGFEVGKDFSEYLDPNMNRDLRQDLSEKLKGYTSPEDYGRELSRLIPEFNIRNLNDYLIQDFNNDSNGPFLPDLYYFKDYNTLFEVYQHNLVQAELVFR